MNDHPIDDDALARVRTLGWSFTPNCPDAPCWCANNTEYLETGLRMVEQPWQGA